jgi:hypothetical protein
MEWNIVFKTLTWTKEEGQHYTEVARYTMEHPLILSKYQMVFVGEYHTVERVEVINFETKTIEVIV